MANKQIKDFTLKAPPDSADQLVIQSAAGVTFKTTVGDVMSGADGMSGATLYADQLDNPNNADWAINALAPVEIDDNFSALKIRAFSHLVEEGVGFLQLIPATAANMTITTKARARSLGGGVVPVLYNREIPNGSPVESQASFLASAVPLTTQVVPVSENFVYNSETKTLAAWGIVAGSLHQFELTRDPGEPGDTLLDDWMLIELGVTFS